MGFSILTLISLTRNPPPSSPVPRRAAATLPAPFRPVRPTRAQAEASIARRNASGPLKGRLLCADIAGGREPLPIPVWDEVAEPPPGAAAADGKQQQKQKQKEGKQQKQKQDKQQQQPEQKQQPEEKQQQENGGGGGAEAPPRAPWPCAVPDALSHMGIPSFGYIADYQ